MTRRGGTCHALAIEENTLSEWRIEVGPSGRYYSLDAEDKIFEETDRDVAKYERCHRIVCRRVQFAISA